MENEHKYEVTVSWTGNKGTGTSGYTAYDRAHTVSAKGKQDLPCSSDPHFRGDPAKYNPEELFVASVSACHMLWFLHLCADNGITVIDYQDNAKATMLESSVNRSRFVEICLYPLVTVNESTTKNKLDDLHRQANEKCFIANSCNFPIKHQGRFLVVK